METVSSSESSLVLMESCARGKGSGCGGGMEDGRPEKDKGWIGGSLLRMLILGTFQSGVLARKELPRNSVGIVQTHFSEVNKFPYGIF